MSALHADALNLLRGWTPPTPEQEHARIRYVRHLERNPDGLARECRPDHVTASALVVSADRRRVLLTLHAKANRWFQMGGHCERGDVAIAGAALREATEESGVQGLRIDPAPVQLDAHDVPFCSPHGIVQHLDVRFLALAPADAVPSVSEESTDVAWWPITDLPTDEPGILELVALARARLSG